MNRRSHNKNNTKKNQVNKIKYNDCLHQMDLVAACKAIARSYKVKVRFKFHGFLEQYRGGAIPIKQKLEVHYDLFISHEWLLSIFFHELAHCLNYQNKKFLAYHSIPEYIGDGNITKKHIRRIIKTGLRAERYTDKVAKQLMKKHCIGYKYLAGYSTEWAEREFRETFLQYYKDLLTEM